MVVECGLAHVLLCVLSRSCTGGGDGTPGGPAHHRHPHVWSCGAWPYHMGRAPPRAQVPPGACVAQRGEGLACPQVPPGAACVAQRGEGPACPQMQRVLRSVVRALHGPRCLCVQRALRSAVRALRKLLGRECASGTWAHKHSAGAPMCRLRVRQVLPKLSVGQVWPKGSVGQVWPKVSVRQVWLKVSVRQVSPKVRVSVHIPACARPELCLCALSCVYVPCAVFSRLGCFNIQYKPVGRHGDVSLQMLCCKVPLVCAQENKGTLSAGERCPHEQGQADQQLECMG